jgi:hypothetical protein
VAERRHRALQAPLRVLHPVVVGHGLLLNSGRR